MLPPPVHVGRRPRIALYGHDTFGLGHFRRNQALASAFAGPGLDADVLILSGAAAAGRFERPPGVDLVVLPGVDKDGDGSYAPSHLRQPLAAVVQVRAAVAGAALRAFAPDVVVVDKMPLGFERELAGALPGLRARGTRLVLGLRDVLDEPTVARHQWRDERCTETIRSLYDEVWVYGDPAVHDLVETCAMPPAVAARAHHLGYLVRRRAHAGSPPVDRPVPGPYVLAMVGGGRDGSLLADTFVTARPPAGRCSVLITGPYLPADVRQRLAAAAARRRDLTVVDFVADLSGWLRHADAVVAMAGANTVTEVLDTSVPVLLVPRVRPRREQFVRAAALADRGIVDIVHPDDLRPSVVSGWMDAAVHRRVERHGLAIDGLDRACARVRTMLAGPASLGDAEVFDVAV